MEYVKSPSMKPAKGGYIVTYEQYCASHDAYDGVRYVGTEQEIFSTAERDEAIDRLDELYAIAEEDSGAMEKERSTAAKKKAKVKA